MRDENVYKEKSFKKKMRRRKKFLKNLAMKRVTNSWFDEVKIAFLLRSLGVDFYFFFCKY